MNGMLYSENVKYDTHVSLAGKFEFARTLLALV